MFLLVWLELDLDRGCEIGSLSLIKTNRFEKVFWPAEWFNQQMDGSSQARLKALIFLKVYLCLCYRDFIILLNLIVNINYIKLN